MSTETEALDETPSEDPDPRKYVHTRLDVWLVARDALKGSGAEFAPGDIVELAEFLAGDNRLD